MIRLLLIATVTAALLGCESSPRSLVVLAPMEEHKDTDATQLHALVEDYFDDYLALNPVDALFVGDNQYNHLFNRPVSTKSLSDSLALEKKYLARLKKISATRLNDQDLLTYQIFKRDREMGVEEAQFPNHLLPLNQMSGDHNLFAALGSGNSVQPFNTVEDYQNFIQRSHGFARWMDSAIAAMRKGIKKGVVQPRIVMEKVLPQLRAHIVDSAEDSLFYNPVRQMPTEFSLKDQQAIKEAYVQLITQTLIPAYRRMHDFIAAEYLPHTRSSVGYSDLPNGKAWYAYKIAENTTLTLSPVEIHQYGLDEVERIRQEMLQVKEQVRFRGNLHAFFKHLQTNPKFYFKSPEEVVTAYTDIKHKINQAVPALFEIFPKADYEVRPVEAFRAASAAGASYQAPSPDGSRPGVFYINTHNLKAQPRFLVETLSIHEAAPGHHFQISIQQEVKGLPRFRRFGGYTAYAEGWALYAESLGKELGLFTDPYMWYGRLADEQLRAMRLVVDTGLHAMGWTREEAIAFMQKNSSMADSDIIAEVERYIAIPGQALSYKLGQQVIQQLREEAQTELGLTFDIKAFHTQILIDGALPLPILKKKIRHWIVTQKI